MQIDFDVIEGMDTRDIRHYIVEYAKVARAARAKAQDAYEEERVYTEAVEALAKELVRREGSCIRSAP